jgi:cardiolipin synthase
VNLPNIITLCRLASVPAIVWLIIEGHWRSSFALFVAAGVSDAIDGILARRLRRQTTIGAYLDPLADKALLVAVYVTLAIADVLPNWLAILVVSRDVLIVGGVLLAHAFGERIEIRPSFISKTNTTAQIVLAAVMLAGIAFRLSPLQTLVDPLVWLVAGTTLASGLDYTVRWLRQMGRVGGP